MAISVRPSALHDAARIQSFMNDPLESAWAQFACVTDRRIGNSTALMMSGIRVGRVVGRGKSCLRAGPGLARWRKGPRRWEEGREWASAVRDPYRSGLPLGWGDWSKSNGDAGSGVVSAAASVRGAPRAAWSWRPDADPRLPDRSARRPLHPRAPRPAPPTTSRLPGTRASAGRFPPRPVPRPRFARCPDFDQSLSDPLDG